MNIRTISSAEPRSNLRTSRRITRRVSTATGSRVLAYGRDPYFSGWPDTLQLNYGNAGLREAMAQTLLRLAGMCDGVRCDMAMLILPEVFERTWHIAPAVLARCDCARA